MYFYIYSELQQCNRKDTSIVTATSCLPLTAVYDNFDPLSQSTLVKTTHLYENIPTVSSTHHQNNIEMNQCAAYGVLTK